jgi:toxin YoeB
MGHITATELTRRLDEYVERVASGHDELVITREDRPAVVMLRLADYESLKETLHLLSSRTNAERLRRSIVELDAGAEPNARCSKNEADLLDRCVDGLPQLAANRSRHPQADQCFVREISRDPFRGTRKPEPLRGELSRWWPRRVTGEHRLVYRVTGTGEAQSLEIASCSHHY